MGSFNETCALSGLNIPYSTPVRLLFLTQNPFTHADEHAAQRGCYHNDQWFVRTPPIKGVYDDYGRARLKQARLAKLVAATFDTDVVERPYGFNQYHAPPVSKGQPLDHYLQAAWEGRLLVHSPYDQRGPDTPSAWPTWQRVKQTLREWELPVAELEAQGLNVQEVQPGIVCVHVIDCVPSKGGSEEDLLARAQKVLDKTFDCQILQRFPDRQQEPVLMVTVQGGLRSPGDLVNRSQIHDALNRHPQNKQIPRYRQLPVLAVMVREDVWTLYSQMDVKEKYRPDDKQPTVDGHLKRLQEMYSHLGTVDWHFKKSDFMAFRHGVPFEVSWVTHLEKTKEIKGFAAEKELLQACAELFQVEHVMELLHQPWHIPPLGGQDGEWDLRTELLSGLHAISKRERDRDRD